MVVIAVLGGLVAICNVLGNVIFGDINVMLNLILVWGQNVINLNMGGVNLVLGTIDFSLVGSSLILTVSLIGCVLLVCFILSEVELLNDLI